MPWSTHEGKDESLAWIRRRFPTSARILDVGPGAGAYADLLKSAGYEQPDAVEIFAPYVDRFGLAQRYRKVHIADICAFTPDKPYDLAILGDVLEHISTSAAQDLIARLPSICKHALFSVPWTWVQGPSEGNDAETHLQPDLTPGVMASRFPSLKQLMRGSIIGLYEWTAPIDWPHVTVCTLTHARVALLEHCMASVQQLKYPGTFDHLIINDCPEQSLNYVSPNVNVVNISGRVLKLGDKRNIALALARGPWIAWVDDDDSLMPHHLMKLEHALRANAECLRSIQTLYFCGDVGEVTSGACMDAMMTKAAAQRAGGFPSRNVGEDWPLIQAISEQSRAIDDPSLDPTYIQGWCNSSHHITGHGDVPDAQAIFRSNALQRIASGAEPSGRISLKPRTINQHVALAPAVADAWRAKYGHQKP